MARMIWIAVLLVGLSSSLAAQDKPDFSGRWVLESPSQPTTDIPRVMTIRQVLTRTNVFGQPMKPFFKEIAVDDETYPIGVVAGRGGSTGPEHRLTVEWDGNSLVFESTSYTRPGPETG